MDKLNPDALAESGDVELDWLDANWSDWNEDGTHTNGEVMTGALAHWRGRP